MQGISKKKLEELKIKKEVEKEFPESYGLQQVHLARLIIEEKTRGLTGKELMEYYQKARKALKPR